MYREYILQDLQARLYEKEKEVHTLTEFNERLKRAIIAKEEQKRKAEAKNKLLRRELEEKEEDIEKLIKALDEKVLDEKNTR